MELWQTWEIEREKGEGKSPPVIEQSRHCDEHHEKEKRLVDADDDNYFFFMIITFFFLFFLMMIILTFSFAFAAHSLRMIAHYLSRANAMMNFKLKVCFHFLFEKLTIACILAFKSN